MIRFSTLCKMPVHTFLVLSFLFHIFVARIVKFSMNRLLLTAILMCLCHYGIMAKGLSRHDREHLRQLCALNTMVGTAPANTKTAGLFGKGSEEHGQTMPAVLSPNGQNFWTPQTRESEAKCVSPYYYTDTMLQGFRGSHWTSGSCTQDYGSFTIATLGGKLRKTAKERATRFSHAEETSHPHYYSVRLPDEHLTTEMTASSHAVIFRITPEQDGPIHIVVEPNSDEKEGHIEVEPQKKTVYGFNPVHRIYQGWGESAGFSGHLLLTYTDEPTDCGQDSTCAWITFQGKAGKPIIVKAATSFTGREGAELNYKAEAKGVSFDKMKERLARTWIRHLHAIDVEDSDTARIDQFYGALYRASFMPHEMSDVDGAYPRFSPHPAPPLGECFVEGRGTTKQSAGTKQWHSLKRAIARWKRSNWGAQATEGKAGRRPYYCDFTMWDTFRAVHPLYTLLYPDVSADMMQSLVTKYEEGGWLPIFPSWNSYTAAMIGDHCSVALADAYIKGIRGFDAEKAYEGMRKNAFETPASEEDYKNGMGRRALQSYLKYGYIPLEDEVREAFHQKEQTSRTLEYAFDDYAVAQMAKALGKEDDYQALMARSENWRNVINPETGYCDGRYADGHFEGNTDLVRRKAFITEGAVCHYTWFVPHNVEGLAEMLGREAFEAKLDSMFTEGRYWHGNEPCHQIAYLYDFIGKREKTVKWVDYILDTEYNDTPGGLSGNDDSGQMSSWFIFSSMGFYPVCPSSNRYMLGRPRFRRITLNLQNGRRFVITPESLPKDRNYITHEEIVKQ